MEKTITIDGRSVNFKATSGTFRRYRMHFQRDLLTDMQHLGKRIKGLESSGHDPELDLELTPRELEMFENIAWTLAKTADDTIPGIDTWLDNFESFSIYEILPELLQLLASNMETTVPLKNHPAAAAQRVKR